MSDQPRDSNERIAIRIINKGRSDKHGFPHREMRVFIERHDGTWDRIGTLSASWGRIALFRRLIQAGATALNIQCTITEPVRAQPGLG